MQDIPTSLEAKILRALRGGTKTFGQLELACGIMDPSIAADMTSTYEFSDKLDKELRRLIDCGKVRLVAKKPDLCFEAGTALDQIVKGLELHDAEEGS